MGQHENYLAGLFSLEGKTAIVTGGSGILGGAMARGMSHAGARIALLDRREGEAGAIIKEIEGWGDEAIIVTADVMTRDDLERARDTILKRWGRIDILLNAAGGNTSEATIPADGAVFDVPREILQSTLDLNFIGTVLPCQVFGAPMAAQKQGCIVNISSMTTQRPMTRVVAYSAGKAAVENFTRWLAVEMATKYGPGLRVNALAPGFFIGKQNRELLLNEDGSLTPRGQSIISHTPAGRFGEADELVGVVVWLCSPSASFVTGTTIMIDGGFNAYSGV